MIKTIYLTSLCFLLSAGAVSAQAKPRDEAAQEYKEAETNYKLQKYQEALEGFERSYALSNEPSILFNIAQCYRLLGQLDEARKAYLSFLRDAPNSNPMRANAEARLKEIEDAQTLLATKGSIQISSQQDPAQVFLNGELKGLSPLTLQDLEPGDYRVTLKKEGFSDAEVTASVKPSAASELKEIQLAPLVTLVTPEDPKQIFKRHLGLGVAAGGLLLGGGGITFGALQNRFAKEEGSTNPFSRADQVITLSTMGAGVASLSFGAILYLLNRSSKESQVDSSVTLSATPKGVSISFIF